MNTVDPITTEIIRNAFIAIANDMNATLIRSAFTPIIYEGKDCSVALIDERGDVLVEEPGENARHYLKVNSLTLPKGAVVTTYTGGGGGYGAAIERDAEAVCEDARDGYVSVDRARDAYGIVLTRTLEIDAERTIQQRRSMRHAH